MIFILINNIDAKARMIDSHGRVLLHTLLSWDSKLASGMGHTVLKSEIINCRGIQGNTWKHAILRKLDFVPKQCESLK